MSFTTDFVEKYDGETLGFPEGSYVGECLSLAKVYIQDRYGIYPPPSGVNSAYGYWTNFPDPLGSVLKKIPNTPDLVPKEGWICVWNSNVGGGYGHIDIVLEATIDTFVGFDQNWGGRHAHRVNHDYNNIYGFLAPLEEGEDMVEVPAEKFEELVTKSTEYDKFVDAGYKSVDDVVKVTSQLNADIESLERKNAELAEELENCQEPVADFIVTGKKVVNHPDGQETVETSYKVKES